MHFINIEPAADVDSEIGSHKNLYSLANKRTKSPWFVVLSVAVHALLIFVILANLHFDSSNFDSSNFNSSDIRSDNLETPPDNKIVSYLYTRPKPLPEKQIDNRAQPSIIKAETVAAEPEVPAKPTDLLPEIKTQSVKNDVEEQLGSLKQLPNLAESGETPLSSNLKRFGLRESVRRQLNDIQAQKNNAMIEQASAEFSQSLISPDISPPEFSEEYIFKKENNFVEVDCTSNSQKTLLLVAGLMGGRIVCQQNQFQEFIDKRQGKE